MYPYERVNDTRIVTSSSFFSYIVWLSLFFLFFLLQSLIMFQICIQEVHWPERDKTVLVSFFFFIQSLVIHEATYGYARHCECSLQLINHFLYVIINIICACLYSWVIPWDRECHQVKIGRIWSLNMIYTCMFTSFKISYQQTTYKQSCLTNISH
jgi:hypothetical protein